MLKLITKLKNVFKKTEPYTGFFTQPYFLLGSCRTGKTSFILHKTWHDLSNECKIYVGRKSDTEDWGHTHRLPFTESGLNNLYDILSSSDIQSILLDHVIFESDMSEKAAIKLVDILSKTTKNIRLILDEPSAYMSKRLIEFIQTKNNNISINYTYQSIFQMKQQGFIKYPTDNIIVTCVVDNISQTFCEKFIPKSRDFGQGYMHSPLGNYHAIFNGEYYTGKLSHHIIK